MALNDSDDDWPMMLAAWQDLDVLEGWRAEILGGSITIAPPPDIPWNRIVSDTSRQLFSTMPDDLGCYFRLALSMAEDMLLVPSIVVMPEAELVGARDGEPILADRALLIVEITTWGNTEAPRMAKQRGCAAASVPQYLLIDRYDKDGPGIRLFSQPRDSVYQHVVRVPFGEPIKLHSPIDLVLDTSEF